MTINGPKIYFPIPIFGGIPITQTLVTSFLVTLILCGLGILLVKNTMDDVQYAYADGKNVLTIVKNL